jgi:hypothetical protein
MHGLAVKFHLEIEITGSGSTFKVTGERDGKVLARGFSTESAMRALDLAVADVASKTGHSAGLVGRMLIGFRKLLPPANKDKVS